MDVADPDILDWVTAALGCGVSSLEDIVRWLEGGPRSASLDLSAWDNTMAALVWAVTLGLTSDRVSGIPGTEEDLQRLRRVHALGIEALSGRERSPDLLPLAGRCLQVILTPSGMLRTPHPP